MKFRDYVRDKIIIVLINLSGMLILSEYLSMVGNTISTIILIDVFWFIILCNCFLIGWYTRNRYFTELKKRVSALNQPWLISEVLPVSFRLEDIEYQKVIQNIGATAIEQIHRMEDKQKEYEEYRWYTGILEKLNNINLCSGGEMEKLSLIRVLQKDSSLLLLDEPTTGLDFISVRKLMEILLNDKSKKITIIVTHDQRILEICDEIIELR